MEDIPGNTNLFNGHVRQIVYQGNAAMVYIDQQYATSLVMRCSKSTDILGNLNPGDAITVGLHRDDTVIVSDDEPGGGS